jgi:TonB family protein
MRARDLLRIGAIGMGIAAAGEWSAAGQTRPGGAQAQRPAAADGQLIRAKDGDTVIVEGDARLRIIRNRQANIRAVFNPAQRFLVVLADLASDATPADGIVDMVFTFRQVADPWPLEERWDGSAVIEEYSALNRPAPGMGLQLPQGLVQLLSAQGSDDFRSAKALAVLTYSGFGSGTERLTFDAAEQRAMSDAIRNAGTRSQSSSSSEVSLPSGSRAAASVSSVTMNSGVRTVVSDAPIRVGGSVETPRKIRDVAPVVPAAARDAGVFGTVILEITIDPEGAVRNARVLRSIPLLDAAAIEAVREWRYEPTVLNDKPVSVMLVVPLTFQ